jgi:hypothetical protein
MSKKIDSKMMKRAVETLFDYEIMRNGKVSSHSQLERWIISELNGCQPKDSAKALQICLKDMRNIHFEINEPNVDDEVETIQQYYTNHDFHLFDIDGNLKSVAFRKNLDGDDENGSEYYVLVTEASGIDIPATIFEPVTFGLYDYDDTCIWSNNYESSVEMFQNKHINFII